MIIGILSGNFKLRAKPWNATAGSAYRFFLVKENSNGVFCHFSKETLNEVEPGGML